MKTRLLLAMLLTATTVANAAAVPVEDGMPAAQAKAPAHRPLFIVRYVLRTNHAPLPHVVIEPGSALSPPTGAAGSQVQLLGAGFRDPNMLLCSGWSCEGGEGVRSR